MPRPWLGSRCTTCGRMRVADSRGHQCCLACSQSTSDAPLVPVDWPPARIWRIQKAYKEHRQATNDVVRRFGLMRFYPSRDVFQHRVPTFRDPAERVEARPRGRARKLDATAVQKFRHEVEHEHGITTGTLAKRFGIDPRTIRHYLKRLGLKLKKRPARRP